ncbi:MAG: hypothetical protein V4719_05145 [Planctomycetota bacterium]
MQKVKLHVKAELELDSHDFIHIDDMELEELRHIIFEIMETVAPISIEVGVHKIRGTVRFVDSTPYELKVARLASLANGGDPKGSV